MEQREFEVAIVGGGLAGAALAITLARTGVEVAVLEKERVFKDRVRGEFLAPWAVPDLRRLQLLNTLRSAGAIDLPALAGRSLKPRTVATPGGDVSLSYSHTAVQEALLKGIWTGWDHQPFVDATRAYVRGAIDPNTTATKARRRLPFVAEVPPHHPRPPRKKS